MQSWKQDLTFIFLAFRLVNRGGDGTLTMFQNTFIDMFKATNQNVTIAKIEDFRKQLNDQLKEATKDLREKDIESPWQRNLEPGQRSDEVIDKCICLKG